MNQFNLLVKRIWLLVVLAASGPSACFAQLVAYFPMELKENSLVELQSGSVFQVSGNLSAENVAGAEGEALRFDGYSTYIAAAIPTVGLNEQTLTLSMWCAVESYPMMNNDQAVNTATYLAGNLDESKRSGFALLLSSQGDYSFEFYADGWKVTCSAQEKLPKYLWNQLSAVVDATASEVRIYRNSQLVGSRSFSGSISVGQEAFMIGKSFQDLKSGPFLLNTMNGLIDDIRLYNTALSVAELPYREPEHVADLSIPIQRFANDLLRPIFHSMPAAAWTNEPHGLTYYGGKYHLFFQKNANGPYWGRLHWGHLTSENLYDWHEEKIALAPSMDYDWKGCWSGCLFADATLTGGKPHIYYTAVDNGRATIAEAIPVDEQLLEWNKESRNPIIPGRPVGLSDDFRDPYVFTSGGNYYLIVGTSKGGVGATTLHRYDFASKKWSNDGSLFFKGRNASIAGAFWEMPVVVPMDNGRWLFMVTPLGGRQGVEVLYWVGTINSDGTFAPLPAFVNEPKEMELGTMSKDGYGLLSPSLCAVDGKQIAIGIVPDKLPSGDNYSLGWAHTFSLPRELKLDENNLLVQQPYAGLTTLRTTTAYTATNVALQGVCDLTPVTGRCLEAKASFIVGQADKVGFRLFEEAGSGLEVYYDYPTNKIVVDVRQVERLTNDAGSFKGLYESLLPQRLADGSTFDLHVYVDHSILDVFINNRWAFSLRVFPTSASASGVEAFSEGGETRFSQLEAWVLHPQNGGIGTGIGSVTEHSIRLIAIGDSVRYDHLPIGAVLTFYDLSGRELTRTNRLVEPSGTITSPVRGVCLVSVTAPGVRHSVKMNFLSQNP